MALKLVYVRFLDRAGLWRAQIEGGTLHPAAAGEYAGRLGWLFALTPNGDTRLEPSETAPGTYLNLYC